MTSTQLMTDANKAMGGERKGDITDSLLAWRDGRDAAGRSCPRRAWGSRFRGWGRSVAPLGTQSLFCGGAISNGISVRDPVATSRARRRHWPGFSFRARWIVDSTEPRSAVRFAE